MNTLKIAKLIVSSFSILLVICIGLLVLKVADKHSKSNSKNIHKSAQPYTSTISVHNNESILNTFSCNDYLCMVIQKSNNPSKILVISPKTGEIINKIHIKVE